MNARPLTGSLQTWLQLDARVKRLESQLTKAKKTLAGYDPFKPRMSSRAFARNVKALSNESDAFAEWFLTERENPDSPLYSEDDETALRHVWASALATITKSTNE